MAEILPFYGLLPAKEYAPRVAALPYDVYSRREAAMEAQKDRLSFLNIDRPETQFDPSQDMYAPEVYKKADEMLQEEIREGIFRQDREKHYYIYELTMNQRVQTGLVACASIDDYISGVIKKHENTRREKEEDRVRHVDACSAQTGPIFLTYPRSGQISAVTDQVKKEEPLFDFVLEDGIRHRGWRIAGTENLTSIREAFAKIGNLYIADGHHRAASAVRVGQKRRQEHPDYNGSEEFNFFLSVLFPDDELLIMDYNRVVRDLNGLSAGAFLDRVGKEFEVSLLDGPRKPEKKGCMTLCLARGEEGNAAKTAWYYLEVIRKEHGTDAEPSFNASDPVADLDVSLLQDRILGPILGIHNPKQDVRIDFVGGIRGLEELQRRVENGWAAAFAMYPTSIRELFAVADAGRLMPPKSTWFEPKLRSGLFIHTFEH